MKKISFALFFCLCALAGFAQNSKPLDLKEIVSGEFIPQNISGVIPIPGDGEHYSQMNADKTQIIKYFALSAPKTTVAQTTTKSAETQKSAISLLAVKPFLLSIMFFS